MKENNKQLIIETIIIFLVSLLLLWIYTGRNVNIFLTDDNYSEFYPIIEQSYNTLFKEGHLPTYDFYQMNGLIIAEQGYYAQTNPLMLVSYIIEHITGMKINLISVYIFIAFSIGNVLTYILLRKLNISRVSSLLALTGLVISTSLFTYSYWYHVFSNYICVPLILLSILYITKNERSKLSYFISGLCLAFSLSQGNIQFTFYHYAMFGIIMCLLAICKKDIKYIKYLLSNCFVGLLISVPNFLISFNAGNRRKQYIELLEKDAYYMYPNVLSNQIIYSIIPIFIFNMFFGGDTSLGNINTCSQLGYGYLYSGISILLLAIYIIFIAKYILKHKKIEKLSNKKIFIFSVFIATIFFMWWALGKKAGLAILLHNIPFINNFRYIYKITFVFTLLMPIITAFVIEKLLNTKYIKKITIAVLITTFIIGIYNVNYLLTSGVNKYFNGEYSGDNKSHTKYNENQEKMKELGIDTQNYRIIGFLENRNKTEQSHYEDTLKNALYNYSKNTATLLETYSIGGYDTALMNDTYNQCDKILHNLTFGFCFTNAIPSYQFFNKYEKKENNQLKNELVQQIKNNKIKYYSFTKNSVYIEKFKQLINSIDDFNIVGEYELTENYIILEIEGIDSICTNQEKEKIEMKGTIDRIYINIPEDSNSKSINLSFTYYDRIKAYYKNENNKKIYIEVSKDDDGYIVLNDIENIKGSTITIYYTYKKADLAILLAYLNTVVLIIIAIYIMLKNNKKIYIKLIKKNKIIKFLIVGGSSTFIDFIIYMIISNFIPISMSKFISMSISCIYAFFFNRKWTFEYKNNKLRNQIVKYTIVQITNILTNVIINQLLYSITNIKIISYIIATIIAMIVNYLLQKNIVFKEKSK